MKIGVNGAAGAMGRRIINLAAQTEDCQMVAAVERPDHPDLGTDVGLLAGTGPCGVTLSAELGAQPDVLLDFSAPESAVRCARLCAELGVNVIVGTTGLSADQRAEVEGDVAQRVAVLVAPNMAIAMNLMLSLVGQIARALPLGYDVEIVEAHHRRKKDAPSGTARELARRLCDALGRQSAVLRYGREGPVGARPAEEIAIHAVRGGDTVGEHTVIFAGEGERLEVTHRATSRDVFAHGALHAARFLLGREPGLYSMQDVLA